MVLNVESGGPADRAGVLMGDILVGFDAVALADTDDLQAALQHETIGHKAKLKVVRGGTLVELTATVGEKP